MKLRSDYKDSFVEKHGVKLGLMSGFVKVCIVLSFKWNSSIFPKNSKEKVIKWLLKCYYMHSFFLLFFSNHIVVIFINFLSICFRLLLVHFSISQL